MTDSRLVAYLDRIALSTAPAATLAGLGALLASHRHAIAFENLDIPLGRGIRIDSQSVFDKLVTRRRGGYCFEQNRLLGDRLVELGFALRPLLARVHLGNPPDAITVRSHVTLLVTLDGAPWIVDGGFGGSDLPLLPLVDGATATTPDGAAHRLRRTGALYGEWLLERAVPHGGTDGRALPHEDWQAQYSFDLAPVAPDDLEQCNHWTSTRPGTRFTTLHIASIALPSGFASLTDHMLTVQENGVKTLREIANPADYAQVLQSMFKLGISAEEAAALPLFS